MADKDQQAQPNPIPAPNPRPSPPTPEQVAAAEEAERATFMAPADLHAKRNAPVVAEVPKADTEEDKTDAKAGAADADAARDKGDDGADGAADAAAAKKVAETAADEDKSADKDETIPDFLKRRIERANAKETAAEQKVREAETKMRDLEEENARLRAAPPKTEEKALVKPSADNFDSVEEYEAARDTYDTEKAKRDAAASEAAKKPKEEPKPKADDKVAVLKLPLGITSADLDTAISAISTNAGKALAGKLEGVPVLTAPLLVHLGDQAKARMADLAQFIIDRPKTIKAISELPPIKQAAALEQAFGERTPGKVKSDAPAPLDRINSNGAASGGVASFTDFERERNAEELAERQRA